MDFLLFISLLFLKFTHTYSYEDGFVFFEEKHEELHPYPEGKHEDPKRTHRYVRECIKNMNGSETFESIKTIDPKSEYKVNNIRHKVIEKYNDNKPQYRAQYGHHVIVKDPAKMISVLEPSHSNSCKKNELGTVAQSSKQQDCHIAVNAGFFDPHKEKRSYGKCYGNIVSNGHYVQDSHGIQNANFGIRRDGTIVIGYLSQEDVLNTTNGFLQLVSGVGWVLRKGELYLQESVKAECGDTQTTSSLKNFFDVMSARTLIGFDGNGYVHIVQIDGKTWESGMNLTTAGEYMKSLGILNAINLDGGGSATFVKDSNVINYPTDSCHTDDAHDGSICARNVSTIICVHGGEVWSKKSNIQRNKNITKPVLYLGRHYTCDQTYLLAVTLSVLFGITLLASVVFCQMMVTYRSRVLRLTNTTQQKEALRSLLDQNSHHYSGESDEDEI